MSRIHQISKGHISHDKPNSYVENTQGNFEPFCGAEPVVVMFAMFLVFLSVLLEGVNVLGANGFVALVGNDDGDNSQSSEYDTGE